MIDDYWWLLMIIDAYWWLLMIIDDYWWLLMIIDWKPDIDDDWPIYKNILLHHDYWRFMVTEDYWWLTIVPCLLLFHDQGWPCPPGGSLFFLRVMNPVGWQVFPNFFQRKPWYNCSSNMVWHPTGRFIQPIPGGWPAQVSGLLVEDSTGHWTGSHDGTFFWGEIATYEIPSGYD